MYRKDHKGCRNYLRIIPDLFKEMVERLTPYIEKHTTFMRELLEIGLRMSDTLLFIVTVN